MQVVWSQESADDIIILIRIIYRFVTSFRESTRFHVSRIWYVENIFTISHEQLWSELLLNRLNSHLFVSVCSSINTLSALTEFFTTLLYKAFNWQAKEKAVRVHLFRKIRPKQAAASKEMQTTTRLLESEEFVWIVTFCGSQT